MPISGSSNLVLLINEHDLDFNSELFFDSGYIPLVRNEVNKVIDIIKHTNLKVVLINYGKKQIDVIEFVLNIRDIDESLPIFIIGAIEDTSISKAICEIDDVIFVNDNTEEIINRLNSLNLNS